MRVRYPRLGNIETMRTCQIMWNVNTEFVMLSELSVLGFARRDDTERILLNGGLYTWARVAQYFSGQRRNILDFKSSEQVKRPHLRSRIYETASPSKSFRRLSLSISFHLKRSYSRDLNRRSHLKCRTYTIVIYGYILPYHQA